MFFAAIPVSFGFMTLQGILRPPTGGSDLAVAASTLVVVALFHPFRTRRQLVVDRRFHRARYDAHTAVERLAQRTRDQVDLATLEADLRAIISTNLQPSSVGMWLPAAAHTDDSWDRSPAPAPVTLPERPTTTT